MSSLIREVMSNGVPNYIDISFAPSLKSLISEHGFEYLQTVLCLLIDDFCESFSFREDKKMNDIQTIECASFLLEECKDYRIEDYACMFTLAKRNKLVIGDTGKVFDRIDIQLIAQFKDNYAHYRQQEIKRLRKMEEQRLSEQDNDRRKDLPNKWPDVLQRWKELTNEANKERNEKMRIEKEQAEQRRKELFDKMNELAVKNGFPDNPFKPDVFGQK